MEVTERIENPLLDRVELHFIWNHDNSPTPSRSDIRAAAARAEPGAKARHASESESTESKTSEPEPANEEAAEESPEEEESEGGDE